MVSRLDLLPAIEGANVVLIRPTNYGSFDRVRTSDGVTWAGFSQLVPDCPSGNVRMPAEGEALIEWMADHFREWRKPIGELAPPAGK